MAGLKIVKLISHKEIKRIGSGLKSNIINTQAAMNILKELLEDESIDPNTICDITTHIDQGEQWKNVPLHTITTSMGYHMEHAITQITEAFEKPEEIVHIP